MQLFISDIEFIVVSCIYCRRAHELLELFRVLVQKKELNRFVSFHDR